jgi:hypothetical protein
MSANVARDSSHSQAIAEKLLKVKRECVTISERIFTR